MDFWNNLERNWTDFFWLTGDTPETLSILVQQLNNYSRNIRPRLSTKGRKTRLNFRNQVIIQINISILQLFNMIENEPNIQFSL